MGLWSVEFINIRGLRFVTGVLTVAMALAAIPGWDFAQKPSSTNAPKTPASPIAGANPRRSVGEAMSALRPYTGVYRLGGDHRLGIERFISDTGENTLLFTDYQTGLVRPLFQVSQAEFAMGPSFTARSPIELTVHFQMDGQGAVQGVTVQPAGRAATFAERVPSREEEVAFRHGDTSLAGTFIAPATPGPHPAIVLLHGSGPLTRHSFGPWPRFFNSLGMAVLVYDKRGTGASTGVRLDASTGAPKTLSPRYYPDDLADDALAALRFLQRRAEVDRRQIGFWGSSEGGMLATQVAALSKEIAFAIDSSGFMGPLWETLLYQAGALARGRGASQLDIDETMAFTRLWMEVARTGKGYKVFLKRRQAIIASGKPGLLSYTSSDFTSLGQMRWAWKHILTFSPLPALRRVTCPVLGVWGEADPLTDAPKAAGAMREALSKGGNRDVTVKIFPHASHSLMETPSRKGMAPGVFDYLRQWLLARVWRSNSDEPASSIFPKVSIHFSRRCITSGTNLFLDTLVDSIRTDDREVQDPANPGRFFITAGANGRCDTDARNIDIPPPTLPDPTVLQNYLNNTTWGRQANIFFTVTVGQPIEINFDIDRNGILKFADTAPERDEIGAIMNVRQSRDPTLNLYYMGLPIDESETLYRNNAYSIFADRSAWLSPAGLGNFDAAHETGHLLRRINPAHSQVGLDINLMYPDRLPAINQCRIRLPDWQQVQP